MSNKVKCKQSEEFGKVNFKSSKSILNELLNLFRLPNIPNQSVPPQIIAFTGKNKPGLSSDKIAARIIQRKSEAGLPVGPLVGGDVAPDEIMEKIRMEEIVKALTTEARIDVGIRPGSQIQATGGNAGGPIQVFGTILGIPAGQGQIY